MDEEYDVVVLGTGIVECILSGLLSVSGKKVLQTDRNPYYGGESASLNLNEMYKRFGKGDPPQNFGASKDWNIDLILKLIIFKDRLVDLFRCCRVHDYLNFFQVEGSFISRGNKIYKVPATEKEVLGSSLIGLFDKKRLYSFFSDVSRCDLSKQQVPKTFHPVQTKMNQVFESYGIDDNLQELIGHVIALHQNDDYLTQQCIDTFKRIELYRTSLEIYGKSPYIYPEYGLGEIPQAFARLSAVYGGTFMLNTAATGVNLDDSGKLTGVRFGENVVKTKMVIGDPSYFPDRVRKVGEVVRCICILNHSVVGTGDCANCQIIIPSRQCKRKSDVYVSVVSSKFSTSPKGFYIAIVGTNVESQDLKENVMPGLNFLNPIVETFISKYDCYEPTEDGVSSNVFISKSYDSTTHYGSVCNDIYDLWKRITGEEFDEEKFAKSAVPQS